MKKYFHYSLAAFLLTFVFVFSSAAQTSSQTANRQLELWKTFSPAGQNFKISVPAEPQKLESTEAAAFAAKIEGALNKNNVETNFFDNVSVYSLKAKWQIFEVVVIDYKWQTLDYDNASGVLTLSSRKINDEIVLDQWLEFERVKMLPTGMLVSDREITKDGLNYRLRIVATKNKVYMLAVTASDLNSATPALAKVYQTEADKFFNSFQILDNKPQIARGTVKSLKATN